MPRSLFDFLAISSLLSLLWAVRQEVFSHRGNAGLSANIPCHNCLWCLFHLGRGKVSPPRSVAFAPCLVFAPLSNADLPSVAGRTDSQFYLYIKVVRGFLHTLPSAGLVRPFLSIWIALLTPVLFGV